MKLAEVAINRPVLTGSVTVAAFVLGLLALSNLGVDLLPGMSMGVVTVSTPFPGADPEEVEQQVTRRIEEVVSTLNGVDEIRSYSRESLSVVVIMFNLDANIAQGVSDVRDKIALLRNDLPRDVLEPIVARIDPNAEPVVGLAVTSSRTLLQTRALADELLRPGLERTEGVGAVVLRGGEEREITVQLEREKLEARGVTVAQVAQLVGAEGHDVPAGRVTVNSREVAIKASGRYRTVEEIGDVVVAGFPNGAQIKVSDLGRVVDGVKQVRTLARVNGKPCVLMEVQKQSGTNTVAVVDAVQATLAQLSTRLPPDVSVTRVFDGSRFVRTTLHELWAALLEGAAFAVLVIFLFMLDWRSTLISALALPTSLVVTFFVMWRLGFTLNLITMIAMTLVIGLLIDDSVVVRENIFRHLERGEDPRTAAQRGTSEIALAVMATTFAVVAVFFSMVFTHGVTGLIFGQFGLTVTAAVLVSLLVSFTVDPMLSANLVQKLGEDHHARMRRHRLFGPLARGLDALDAFYLGVIRWALGHRTMVVVAAVVVFFGSLGLARFVGLEFFGRPDQGQLLLDLELPASTPLGQTDAVAKRVEAALRAIPEITTVTSTVGPGEEVDKVTMRIGALPQSQRAKPLTVIMDEVRDSLGKMPGLTYNLRDVPIVGAGQEAMLQAPITLYVQGADFDELKPLAREVYRVVGSVRGVRDPFMRFRAGAPEEHWIADRTRAGDLGVSFAEAALTLRTAVLGEAVAKFRDGEKDADVRVMLAEGDRRTPEDLGALGVPSRRLGTVRLSEVTRRERSAVPATIERIDRQRQITITANVSDRPLGDVLAELQVALEKVPRKPGYGFKFAGEAERMKESFSSMVVALVFAVVFVYLVLASQFESLVHPLTILLSIPMASVGAIALILLTGLSLGLPAMVGIILLMGMVTKNGILLVDCANQLREGGLSAREAMLQAGPRRLRPILMTSAAMILGMLPAALGRGEGWEVRVPIAVAVIGGLLTSTLLTLVVVPVVYLLLDRFTARGRQERVSRPAAETLAA